MWIVLSLLSAIFLATSDALTKQVLVSRDEYFVAWVRLIFALPLLLLSMLFVEVPLLDKTFWLAVICALPLEIAALILYTKALKVSPISLAMPFLALTPLFMIFTAGIILGEGVSVYGGAGILFMAIGSYFLNIHMISKNILEPVKAIFREKGCVMMIAVAFIFSITASLAKVAIEHSSPVFFGGFYFVLVTILFTPIALKMNRGRINIDRKDVIPLALIGLSFSLMVFFTMLALSMSNVAYVISIKRTSLIFSIAYGHYLFKEKRITEKAFGSTIMLSGFVLIVLGK